LPPRRSGAVPLLIALSLVAAACLGRTTTAVSPGAGTATGPGPAAGGSSSTLRLGYQPELTQATAVYGVQQGIFTKAMGTGITFQSKSYADQPAEEAALASGALDAAYLDPNEAVAAYLSTKHGVRIVSGATSGGAFLMTTYHALKNGPELRGETLAAPGAGTTPDVALRTYLLSQGLTPGVNVTVVDLSEASILREYGHQIQGGWVPEEWAARMQIEDDANVFVDESKLWPNGAYATAVLVVREAYLQANPAAVADLLLGQVIANDQVKTGAPQVESTAAAAIRALTGNTISQAESDQAWSYLNFTDNPIASSIQVDATDAAKLGLIKSSDISGIYDLNPLNQVLSIAKEPAVTAG
jgi:NitT/TauT family transport system substrate-binding protein